MLSSRRGTEGCVWDVVDQEGPVWETAHHGGLGLGRQEEGMENVRDLVTGGSTESLNLPRGGHQIHMAILIKMR